MKKGIFLSAVLIALFIFSYGIPQEKADNMAILGKWKIEVDADGQYYHVHDHPHAQ